MRSLLVVYDKAMPASRTGENNARALLPEYFLQSHGYQISRAANEEQAMAAIVRADAAVLHLSVADIKMWGMRLRQWKQTPQLWWCSESAASQSLDACEDDVTIDGILSPSMREHELHWAIHFSSMQFHQRRQLLDEREQLLARMEERKWIDMAKGILCKIKGISESEAYDMLRKQAMNERKRMVDVATSIVKVYELLQDQKQGGKR